jgi:hypothetical protein
MGSSANRKRIENPRRPPCRRQRISATSPGARGGSGFDCDIPWNSHHAAPPAKIWLRRNGLRLRQHASPAPIASGRTGGRLVLTRGPRALQRTNGRHLGTPAEPMVRSLGDPLTPQRFQIWRRTGPRGRVSIPRRAGPLEPAGISLSQWYFSRQSIQFAE